MGGLQHADVRVDRLPYDGGQKLADSGDQCCREVMFSHVLPQSIFW